MNSSLLAAFGGQKIFVNISAKWWILLFVGAEGGQIFSWIQVLSDGFYCLLARPEFFSWIQVLSDGFSQPSDSNSRDIRAENAGARSQQTRVLILRSKVCACGEMVWLENKKKEIFPASSVFLFWGGKLSKMSGMGRVRWARSAQKKIGLLNFKLVKKQTKILSFCAVSCFLHYMALLFSSPPMVGCGARVRGRT